MRRKRTYVVMVVSLFGAAAVAFLLRTRNDAGGVAGAETGGGEAKQVPTISDAEELERSSLRRSERKEVPASSLEDLPVGWRGHDQAAVPPSPEVVKAAERVGKVLMDDEAARSKLVREEEKDGHMVYRFEVARREHYNKYLDDLLRQEAKAAGVDAGTLGGVVRQNFKSLDIPQGHQQLVEIMVPLDPKKEASFKGFSILPEDVGKTSYPVKIGFGGVVPIGAKDWRYSRLLDLGNP